MSAPRTPFHDGEVRAQSRLGLAEKMAAVGARAIRDHLVDQHRAFFAAQSMLLLARVDGAARPWASVLAGPPGFAFAPAARRLRIAARPVGGAPHGALAVGERVGVLGIDYATRRRNRVNGHIAVLDDRCFEIQVEQSFGNCPKYIQRRTVSLPEGEGWCVDPPVPRVVDTLDGAIRDLIEGCDHFYIASHHPGDASDPRNGADVSHRGGRAGFVRVVDGSCIEFPDFAGNRFFNTLGNIEATGRAGLLFIDFSDGSVVSLSGDAIVDWRAVPASQIAGAERTVRVDVQQAWMFPRALPLQWRLVEQSPALQGTGAWPVAHS